MSSRLRTTFLSLAIIIVLVFSATAPLTVYADDGTPPEATTTPVTEPTQPEAGSEGTSTESVTDPQPTGDTAPAADATATPVPVADSQPVVDEGTTAVPVAADPAVPAEGQAVLDPNATILSDVPANTDVTVLDASGNAQPLVTQEAANAIATSDPIWCPGSQVPTPGENGCTGSFPSFHDLLTYLSTHPTYQGPGTIYVQQGEYRGSDPDDEVNFNSPDYDLNNINNDSLTITGGWDTTTNTIDSTNPTVFTDYTFLIGTSSNPWGGSLTFNNISIVFKGVPDFGNDTRTGITAYSEGDINLTNINVTAAPNLGAELDANRNVNIRNSNFQQNVEGGVIIRSRGNVNIASSDFSNPYTDRDRWQRVGIQIEEANAVSLFDVLANMNREAGADIYASGQVTVDLSVFSGTKMMWTDDGETQFWGYGLQVVTSDAIVLDQVTANDNFLWGARLNSDLNTTIRDSVFNANTTEDPGFIDDTGLFITSKGSVELDNVTASDNRLYGADIVAEGTVSINNSTFNNNRGAVTAGGVMTMNGHGLRINSLSDIFINNTEAVGNMLFGGELTAGGEVAIANSTFSDTITDAASAAVGKGLDITSARNTSLLNVILNNNQSAGADIQAGGDIFLDNVTAVDNGTNGVMVQGTCTHVNGGLYSGNGQYGIDLGNSALDLVSPPIFANNGAGNINPAAPVSCAPAISVQPPVVVGTVPVNTSSSNLFAANFTSQAGDSGTAKNVSLNSYLANTRTGSTSSNGIFIGEYVYVHSLEGLQIYAVVPNLQLVAMSGS